METTVKVVPFSKRLQARLKELKAQRGPALKKFNADFTKWKQDLALWTMRNAKKKVENITIDEVREARRYRDSDPGFTASHFFIGAPKPPAYPSDKPIREIQRTLRHMAITGQETMRVSSSDIEKWFPEEDDDD